MKYIEQSYEILSDWFNRESVLKAIERAARTCYKSEANMKEGSDVKMLSGLLRRGHTAMIEHAPNLSVRFITNRGVANEMVRHRLFSFAQESQRYVNYNKKDDIEFILPEWADKSMLNKSYNTYDSMIELSDKEKILTECHLKAENSYKVLIEIGLKPEAAADVLGRGIKTEIVVTGNIREWRHFFDLRCDKTAHPMIRELSSKLLLELNEDMPELWGDLVDKYDLRKI